MRQAKRKEVTVEDAMQQYMSIQKGLKEGGIEDVKLKDSLRYIIRNQKNLDALKPKTKAAVVGLRKVAKKRSHKLVLALLAINAFCMATTAMYAGDSPAAFLTGFAYWGAIIMFSNYITYGTALDLDQNIAKALSESGVEVKLGKTSMPDLFTGPHAQNTAMAGLSLNGLVMYTVVNIMLTISALITSNGRTKNKLLDPQNGPAIRVMVGLTVIGTIFAVPMGYLWVVQATKAGDRSVVLEDLARRHEGNYQTLMIKVSEYAGRRGFIKNLRDPLTYDKIEQLLDDGEIKLKGLKVTGLSVTSFAAEVTES